MERTRAKKIICFIAAIAACLLMMPTNALGTIVHAVNAPWYMEELHSFTVNQSSTNFTSKSFDVKNPYFGESVVTEFVDGHTSGWELSNSNAIAGVVNTTAFDTFKGREDFSENVRSDKPEFADTAFMAQSPSSSHSGSPNVLVMANKSTGTATANYSQKLDEFWADGYFEVKVDFYAVRSVSAIYLIPETDFTDGRALPRVDVKQISIAPGSVGPDGFVYSTTAIPNLSVWQTATFLVKTDRLEAVTFKLSLHLGHYGNGPAKGVVYYDNIRVTGYSADKFEQTFNNAKAANHNLTCVVDLSEPAHLSAPNIAPYSATKQISEDFNNETTKFKQVQSFATPDNTHIMPFVRISNIPAVLNMKDSKSQFFGITKQENRGAMLLSAVDAQVSLQYHEPIIINRQEIYMINFYAIASADSIGYFRIRDVRHETLAVPDWQRPNLYNSGFMPVKLQTSASSESHNNWALNSVFLVGEAFEDTKVDFEFWVGGTENTTGIMLVDDFSISRVSMEYYEKHQSSNNVTTCDLDWLTPTATVNNANFNVGSKRSNIAAFPLVASEWQISLEGELVQDNFAERRIINGIVNTDPDHWMKNNVAFTEQQQRDYNMPYGRAYGTAINPYEIWHNQQSINNNIYMMQNVASTYQTVESNSFTLVSDTRNVISFDTATFNLSTREVWAIIEIGDREVTRLKLVPEIGGITGMTDWRNYSIVVQTSRFTSPSTKLTFALGSSADLTTGTLFIDNIRVNDKDIAVNPSRTISVDLNDTSKLFMRTTTNEDIGGESLFFVPEDKTTASAFYNVKSDVLAISTTGVSNAKISNTMIDTLTEEKAYEYIVKIDPNAHVSIDKSYNNTNEKTEPEWGMTIRIKGMDGGFVNLKTEDFKEMPKSSEGFIELRFLVKFGGALELALEIEFGNKDVIVQGAIGIKGLELKEYDDEQFNSAKEDLLTRIITTSTQTPDTDTGEEGSKQSLSFLIIPSLITGAAIIFTIVASTVRRIKFGHHIQQHHTSYARDDFETKIPKKDLKAPTAKKAPKEAKKKQKTDGE